MKHIIGQHMVIGISGHSLMDDEKKFIVENNISGIVLFARNVSSDPNQIRELCAEIQDLRHKMADKAPLYIGIDMEGGRVARLKKPFTVWPPLKKLGDIDSPTVSYNFAEAMGKELKAVGINLDFAPCIDVFTNPQNTVIGDRAVSTDPEMVAKHGSALVRGYLKADVIPCVKHYPGHGNTLADSHEDLPIEEADWKRLEDVELVPFKKTFRSKVEMVMTAHILFKNVDPEWPVTMSKKFLTDLLRDQLNYRGLIITDDLDMKALAKHYDRELIPVKSLEAGADLILYCNEAESPPRAMEAIAKALEAGTLTQAQLKANHARILDMKKRNITQPDPLPAEKLAQVIGNPEHTLLSQCIAKGEMPSGIVATTHAE